MTATPVSPPDYTRAVLINSTGGAECIQIDFTPLGARRFFGLPMHEISGRMVKLEELDDGEIEVLRGQLVEQRNWMKRLDLVEQFVAAGSSGEMLLAAGGGRLGSERIPRSQGDIRISRMTNALDWSRKHLVGGTCPVRLSRSLHQGTTFRPSLITVADLDTHIVIAKLFQRIRSSFGQWWDDLNGTDLLHQTRQYRGLIT